MNYIVGLLVLMAVSMLAWMLPVPTLVAVVIGVAYWLVKGRKGGVS